MKGASQQATPATMSPPSFLKGWPSNSDFTRHENLSNLLTQPPILKDRDGKPAQILVLKVGTSTLLNSTAKGYSLSNLGKFVDSVCDLKDRGFHVVMVSSGAVGSGCMAMKMDHKPQDLVAKQAVASLGQCRLVRLWEDIFAIREQKVAQLLLTRRDLQDRPRFVNFRNTLLQLLKMNVIPIINENDALATEGLKFGDNDTLGAYAAISIGAAWFFMLTDVDCLFTANPRKHPDAQPIAYVGKIDAIHALLDDGENDGTQWGSGGMRTKIIAAKLCCATGIHTALCHGAFPERILDVIGFAQAGITVTTARDASSFPMNPIQCAAIARLHHASTFKTGSVASSEDKTSVSETEESPATPKEPAAPSGKTIEVPFRNVKKQSPRPDCSRVGYITFPDTASMPYLGTIFAGQPCTQHLRDQRRWILSLPVRGRVFCDENCVKAVIQHRKSLFAAGIVSVEEDFYPGEVVALYSADDMGERFSEDNELARFIVNFSSFELQRIKGNRACDFQHILGYYCANEVANRSNIIFINTAPAVERYHLDVVSVDKDMISDDDEEDAALELHDQPYSPVPVPQGECHQSC